MTGEHTLLEPQWANVRVSNRGRPTKMASFRDPSLASGNFLMDLLWSIEPRAINWDLMTAGETGACGGGEAELASSLALRQPANTARHRQLRSASPTPSTSSASHVRLAASCSLRGRTLWRSSPR